MAIRRHVKAVAGWDAALTNYPSLAVRVRLLAGLSAVAIALAATASAKGDTLSNALLTAYATNPDLTSARARLRAIDENVAIAKAAGRIQATGSGDFSQTYDDIGRFRDRGRSLTASAGASLPVYAGGRVRNSVRAADARVIAGRADLRAVEGDVFADVVAGYQDVIRDAYVVDLNDNNIRLLEAEFSASRERFGAGDLTRTDVAQSEARLADARSQLASARGALTISSEDYRRIVGRWPAELEAPPALPLLPATPDDAVDVALAASPDLQSALATLEAAGFDIRVARAARSPVLSASASASYTNYLGSAGKVFGVSGGGLDQDQSSGTLGVSASVPLYQGGGPAARVRQATALQNEAAEQAIGIERAIVADVRAAYTNYEVATVTITSVKTAVSANQLALQGADEEQRAGARTLLDVLNARQELLISQVSLVSALRDQYVAGFALLNAMGRANVETLGLDGGPLYNPLPNYERARRSVSDFNDGSPFPPQATRTVGATPAALPVLAPQPAATPLPPTISETITRKSISPARSDARQ